jgi:hypothetical protein
VALCIKGFGLSSQGDWDIPFCYVTRMFNTIYTKSHYWVLSERASILILLYLSRCCLSSDREDWLECSCFWLVFGRYSVEISARERRKMASIPSVKPVTLLRFEEGTSRIKVRSMTAVTNFFGYMSLSFHSQPQLELSAVELIIYIYTYIMTSVTSFITYTEAWKTKSRNELDFHIICKYY